MFGYRFHFEGKTDVWISHVRRVKWSHSICKLCISFKCVLYICSTFLVNNNIKVFDAGNSVHQKILVKIQTRNLVWRNSVAICYNNKSMDRILSEEQMPVEFLKEFFGQMVWFLVEVSCFYSSQSWIILWSSSLSGQKYVLLILWTKPVKSMGIFLLLIPNLLSVSVI